MSRSIRIVRAVGIAAMVATLAACGEAATTGTQDTASPAPSGGSTAPSRETFREDGWTIEAPAGWTRRDVTADADAEKAIRYEAADGSFFIVALDPTGSDFAYDALWRYEAKADRFEVVERYECAGKDDEGCSDDDEMYTGYVLWDDETGPTKVGGHEWYFMFGDADDTSVDAAVFEEILESIRVAA